MTKYLLALLAVGLIALQIFMLGHHAGYASCQKADTKQIASLSADKQKALDANQSNLSTIAQLRQANAQFEHQAEIAQQAEQQAEAALAQSAIAHQKALAQANKRVSEALNANPTSMAWGREPVPAVVADSLRQ